MHCALYDLILFNLYLSILVRCRLKPLETICKQATANRMKTRKCKMLRTGQKSSAILVAVCLLLSWQLLSSLATDEHEDGNSVDNYESLSSKLYRQNWAPQNIGDNFDSSSAIPDNDIVTGQQHSRQSYACGRAIATNKHNKYNEIMHLNEQHQLSNGLRNVIKYRPFEIRTPRIIGGDETSPGEFPWTVSIKLNGQPICGGSLIDRSWILTAAHCVVGYNPNNLTVRLGAYRIKDPSEQQIIDASISMFIVHNQYSMPRPFSNDIALLKVVEPIDYTDFIIPICLPTEDQESTLAPSDEIVVDYTKPIYSPPDDETGNQHDTGGIVVSTKMSDKEISKCFKRLEQNYLNSIGLGSSPAPPPTVAVPQPPPPIGVLEANGASADSPASQHLAQSLPVDFAQTNVYTGHTSEHTTNRRPAPAPATVKVTFLNAKPVGAEQHFETATTFNGAAKYNGAYYQQAAKQQVYYDLPWNRVDGASLRQAGGAKRHTADGFSLEPKSAQPRQPAVHSEQPPIKLTSLPISKELLREIQSVGSMQSLQLGLQQNDFVAMVNDLGSEPLGNTVERERVLTGSPSAASGQLRQQFVRTGLTNEPDEQTNSIDDPTKYSGMSGIVVGWGWVRENDNEEQQQQAGRGYRSVTLQKVRLPILRNSDCEAWFRSQEKKITLLPSQFCAGYNLGGKDACRGDSGGPMIIEDNSNTGRYKLIGIVSAGIGCARPSLPGLYTRVASFISWINAQIALH